MEVSIYKLYAKQNVLIMFHLFEKTLGLGGISNLYGSHRMTRNMNCYDYNYRTQCERPVQVSLVEKKKVFWVLFCDMSYMIKLFFCTSKVSRVILIQSLYDSELP